MAHQNSSIVVVSTEGERLDRQAVEVLSQRVREAQQAGAKRVVIEASSWMDPQYDGLAAMLAWAAGVQQELGARPALAAPSRALLLAICQTSLQRELDIYSSREAALRDLGSH